MSKSSYFWVYILHCENNAYYTGYTTDLIKRYQSHQDGSGQCKYTRSFKPLTIAQCWLVEGDKALAMKIERQIKSLSRAMKKELIMKPEILCVHQYVHTISHQELQRMMNDPGLSPTPR